MDVSGRIDRGSGIRTCFLNGVAEAIIGVSREAALGVVIGLCVYRFDHAIARSRSLSTFARR